jgi:hypothetical protein
MEKEVVIQQVFSAANYIGVHVVEGPGRTWRLTRIYGYPQWDDKYKTCDKPENTKIILISPAYYYGFQ